MSGTRSLSNGPLREAMRRAEAEEFVGTNECGFYSANTSCNVRNAAASVFAGTTPSRFAKRVLSIAASDRAESTPLFPRAVHRSGTAPGAPRSSSAQLAQSADDRAFRPEKPPRMDESSGSRCPPWDPDSPAKFRHASPSQLRILGVPKFAHHECIVAHLCDSSRRFRPSGARRTRWPP